MDVSQAIRRTLDAVGLNQAVVATSDLSGGCIHRVQAIHLEDGTTVVAKVNREECLPMFEEEAIGLRSLAATNTVLVPIPLVTCRADGTAVLLMTSIETCTAESGNARVDHAAWRRFGEDLAALHQFDAGRRYGFDINNHIGATPQPNAWHDDWVEFNRVNRLGFQLNLAVENHRVRGDESRAIQSVIDRLDRWIPRQPKPALLHGDLWSGNALPAANGRIAVIDPACSVGDGWADIAMMQLFGGFPQVCIDAYTNHVSDHDGVERRIAVYQLYHVLNHLNLFGRGYARQAVSLAEGLLHR